MLRIFQIISCFFYGALVVLSVVCFLIYWEKNDFGYIFGRKQNRFFDDLSKKASIECPVVNEIFEAGCSLNG